MRKRAGRRTSGFKKRLEEEKRSEWTRLCWAEMKEKYRDGKTGLVWEKEKRKFFEDRWS